jgi:hypothetical protein
VIKLTVDSPRELEGRTFDLDDSKTCEELARECAAALGYFVGSDRFDFMSPETAVVLDGAKRPREVGLANGDWVEIVVTGTSV